MGTGRRGRGASTTRVIGSDNIPIMHDDATDRAAVAAEMRDAVRRSGITQAAFARRLGTSASRLSTYVTGAVVPSAVTYRRALRVADALADARRLGRMTPESTAEMVDAAVARGDEGFAVRLILQARDDLLALRDESPLAASSWSIRGRRIRDERLDALLRAVIAHECADARPDWTQAPRLAVEWTPADPFRDAVTVRAQTPPWLADAGIYIAASGLTTA